MFSGYFCPLPIPPGWRIQPSGLRAGRTLTMCRAPSWAPPASVNDCQCPKAVSWQNRRGLTARLCSYLPTMRWHFFLCLRWALLLLPKHVGRTAMSIGSLTGLYACATPLPHIFMPLPSVHSIAINKGILVSTILLSPTADTGKHVDLLFLTHTTTDRYICLGVNQPDLLRHREILAKTRKAWTDPLPGARQCSLSCGYLRPVSIPGVHILFPQTLDPGCHQS